MMRRLVERHHGILPLDTVESIWRVIIATFTHVQAPYSVHADLTAGEARDARFRALSFRLHGAVRDAYGRGRRDLGGRASKGDLGIVPAIAVAGAGAWWTMLEASGRRRSSRACPLSSGPIIRLRCRFLRFRIRRQDAIAEGSAGLQRSGVGMGRGSRARACSALAEAVAVPDGAFDGAALLVSVPEGKTLVRRHRRVNAGRHFGALVGPRREPRDPLYGHRRTAGAGCALIFRCPEYWNDRSYAPTHRVPACSTSRPTCRARAPRPASRRCSSFRPTRRRSARARRRSRPIARWRANCRNIPTAPRPNCARRSGAPSASIRTASSAARDPTIS